MGKKSFFDKRGSNLLYFAPYLSYGTSLERIAMIRGMKTYLPKPGEIERKCFLVDAQDKILGRLATRIAKLLIGKDEPFYTPHLECGDQVVVINAKGIRVTGKKSKQKTYERYTGYPGGRRIFTFEQVKAKDPTFIIREAVRRMLPKNRLADKMLKHLHVYPDASHKQAAQKPIPIQLN
jgi:large subunit ribosomal protein L13